MVTDYELALACARTYTHIPQNFGTEVTHVFLSQAADGTKILAFEGTSDNTEWFIDFEAVPIEERGFHHDELGYVHLGWWQDVVSVSDSLLAWLAQQTGPVACTGHSKGAAEALIFAALAKTKGFTWARVSTFGTPHPGDLKGLITSKDGKDYWNIHTVMDPVPLVPPYLGRPRLLTHVVAPSPQIELPGYVILTSHHIVNYVAALKESVPC